VRTRKVEDWIENLLNTRPVSSTFPATAVPEMRDSRIEETSEAADVTWYVLRRQGSEEERKLAWSAGNSTFLKAWTGRTWLRGGI